MKPKKRTRIALVVPHIFANRDILTNVIFSPGELAIDLANGLKNQETNVTLFTPGPVDCDVPNINADLTYFENELKNRGDNYVDLLRKHPFLFVSLARQVQSELIADAFHRANNDEFDIVHIYTNEEDIALPFAKFCKKPVVFTHHDPFNFYVRYKNNFPKYKHLNWLSISFAQRNSMPKNTNWVGNIYHGLNPDDYQTYNSPKSDYIAYLGRIIKPKGVELAIKAVREYNKSAKSPLKLKIAGKHYSDNNKDTYWANEIKPELDEMIEYVGFIKDKKQKNDFLANAKALIIPSTFEEPFGMVVIEALASGTPVIGLDSGAIPEIINPKTGILVKKSKSDPITIKRLSRAIGKIDNIDRKNCRIDLESRFTIKRMCKDHADLYYRLIN